MTTNIPLGPGAEFDAIRALLERWGPHATGIGDDAAVLRLPRGDALVASVDTAIEGRHFEAEWLTPNEIGYRAVAAALSDLAAMAARPLGLLVAIGLPSLWRGRLTELADGIGLAASLANAPIVGGNLSAAGELSITTTALGSAFAPLGRDGGCLGDLVYVTGVLGAPAAALRRFRAGEPAAQFRERFAHPTPRLAEARWLADHGASAAIDISDGLVADLRHLAWASGVSVELDAERVPCVDGVDTEVAMQSGEEYELLVTARVELDADAFERRFHVRLTEVGRAIEGAPGSVNVVGVRVADLRGHDHFSG